MISNRSSNAHRGLYVYPTMKVTLRSDNPRGNYIDTRGSGVSGSGECYDESPLAKGKVVSIMMC